MDAELRAAIDTLDAMLADPHHRGGGRRAWNLVRTHLVLLDGAATELVDGAGEWTIDRRSLAELRRVVKAED